MSVNPWRQAAVTIHDPVRVARGGLPKDDVQAVNWYSKAADGGDAQALAALKRLGK